MSKWVVTVELEDPESANAGEIRDQIGWALEENVNTEHMRIGAITVRPQEGSTSHVRSDRHYPRRVRSR